MTTVARIPENIQVGRRLINIGAPYFDALNWSVTPYDTPGLGTMATDKHWRMYFDGAVVREWDVERVTVIMLHELIHIMLKHHRRVNDNEAADLAVNSWIKELLPSFNRQLERAGISLRLKEPDDWLSPEKYNFPPALLLEEYHELLQKQRQKKPSKGSGNGNGSSKDKGEPGKPDVGKGKCGSCAGDGEHPWELPDPYDGGPEGLSEPEIDVRTQQVAEQIVEAVKTIGNLPGGMARWAQSQLEPPKVSWQDKLKGMTRLAVNWAMGCTVTSWRKINRRSPMDMIFPGLMNPVPNVAVVVDTSGSMSEKNLLRALSETQGVLRACGYQAVPTLIVDAAVHSVQKVTDARQLKLVGGGGTAMDEGIQGALKLRPRPQVIIIFTDGFTSYGDPITDARVIAVLVQKGAPQPPPWIRCVEVDD